MTSALPDLLLARVPAYWKVMDYGGLSGYIDCCSQPAGCAKDRMISGGLMASQRAARPRGCRQPAPRPGYLLSACRPGPVQAWTGWTDVNA